jgi:hypothetical protein
VHRSLVAVRPQSTDVTPSALALSSPQMQAGQRTDWLAPLTQNFLFAGVLAWCGLADHALLLPC